MNAAKGYFTPLTPQVFHILLALHAGECHGYGIMSRILRDSDSQMNIPAGTLYPALKRLAQAGLIEALPGGRYVEYLLTPTGLAALKSEEQLY